MADYALVKLLLHVEQPFRLFSGQAGNRNPGPHTDYLGYVLFGDHRPVFAQAFLPLLLQSVKFIGVPQLPVA